MKLSSTREAAEAAGISLVTLQRWIARKKIRAPRMQRVGGVKIRLWSKQDIERIRLVKKK